MRFDLSSRHTLDKREMKRVVTRSEPQIKARIAVILTYIGERDLPSFLPSRRIRFEIVRISRSSCTTVGKSLCGWERNAFMFVEAVANWLSRPNDSIDSIIATHSCSIVPPPTGTASPLSTFRCFFLSAHCWGQSIPCLFAEDIHLFYSLWMSE